MEKDKFIEFLENNCNLSKNNKIKGRIVKNTTKLFIFGENLSRKMKSKFLLT